MIRDVVSHNADKITGSAADFKRDSIIWLLTVKSDLEKVLNKS